MGYGDSASTILNTYTSALSTARSEAEGRYYEQLKVPHSTRVDSATPARLEKMERYLRILSRDAYGDKEYAAKEAGVNPSNWHREFIFVHPVSVTFKTMEDTAVTVGHQTLQKDVAVYKATVKELTGSEPNETNMRDSNIHAQVIGRHLPFRNGHTYGGGTRMANVCRDTILAELAQVKEAAARDAEERLRHGFSAVEPPAETEPLYYARESAVSRLRSGIGQRVKSRDWESSQADWNMYAHILDKNAKGSKNARSEPVRIRDYLTALANDGFGEFSRASRMVHPPVTETEILRWEQSVITNTVANHRHGDLSKPPTIDKRIPYVDMQAAATVVGHRRLMGFVGAYERQVQAIEARNGAPVDLNDAHTHAMVSELMFEGQPDQAIADLSRDVLRDRVRSQLKPEKPLPHGTTPFEETAAEQTAGRRSRFGGYRAALGNLKRDAGYAGEEMRDVWDSSRSSPTR